jgi:rubredoxin/uncharacterized membrane protein
MKKWQCTVCGYIHEGEEPPEECPVCGADKSKFVLLQEKPTGTIPKEPDPADSQTGKPLKAKQTASTAETGTETNETPASTPFPSERFDKLGQLLTRFHGHPIAVHIPNGLLPVAVLFALIALMFGSQGFATAAKYNTLAVALAMPLVIFTGLVDWNNRYGRRMTHVFIVKMICAGIVTILSVVLGIWWLFSPAMHARGFGANGFFVFLNLINLAAAIVAGWYGGKLVFKK